MKNVIFRLDEETLLKLDELVRKRAIQIKNDKFTRSDLIREIISNYVDGNNALDSYNILDPLIRRAVDDSMKRFENRTSSNLSKTAINSLTNQEMIYQSLFITLYNQCLLQDLEVDTDQINEHIIELREESRRKAVLKNKVKYDE